MSWLSELSPGDGVGAISVIRLLRVFRVVKVIKRLTELRRIVKALLSSVIPVSYSLLLLALATAIAAVVATDLLSGDGEAGRELFGSFSASFFTMWQVGTGDGWSDVVREFRREDGRLNPMVAFFLNIRGGWLEPCCELHGERSAAWCPPPALNLFIFF